MITYIGDLKITSASTERQNRSQNLAPVLVIISGSSLVFSRKIITSTGFYRCCAPGASAPAVIKKPVSQYKIYLERPEYPKYVMQFLPKVFWHPNIWEYVR